MDSLGLMEGALLVWSPWENRLTFELQHPGCNNRVNNNLQIFSAKVSYLPDMPFGSILSMAGPLFIT